MNDDMIVCIIAGGSGTRLWPLSTSDYPKHLLKVDGDEYSLLQNTYNRAKKVSDSIYVITDSSHVQHVRDQLPELTDNEIVVEPARRGTASCIIAALAHIYKIHGEDEVVASIHSDHYIRDTVGFVHSLRVAEEASKKSERITLIGVEPDYPAIGFGYIKKAKIYDEESLVYEVDSFKEKPDAPTARNYLRSGKYLWNCGYFVGSVKTFRNQMKQYAPDLNGNFQKLVDSSDEEYKKTYLQFENIAIDFALIEKVKELLVVPATFDWMDLGSYEDLHKAVGADASGNYAERGNIELADVENSYIENHEDKPVAVIGLDNIVVINTKDGILVARKDLGQKVGEVAKLIAKKGQ